ncbi:hypothetical protein [Psychrobacillus lasiicapitis]|uniref:Uncharacterized protein n=1 Tax=Psychrobacillus lasiicapitis TaxID=1636719 RepID=A0A544TI32_9BACI|nr:hypothetical protein [Psychrobacillus lasiicapitis]TQR17112.1 hypothetical protein FG382_02915 [Psychrobacillus lasiicapitis]GGA24393.1 hypothetical protein GCM10011384_11960 [Psychrobacillus lasiicapitis]
MNLLILPKGITGFVDNMEEKIDGQLFKKNCFDVMREVKGEVLKWEGPLYPYNYFKVHIRLKGELFYILLNEYYPYLAFVNKWEENVIEFTDLPALTKGFTEYYSILTKKELDLPFSNKGHDLEKVELKQAAYWQPRSIGEVIFNCWD